MSFGLIYEHWRLDTNECFYIGKAMGTDPYARANNLNRNNRYHKRIVKKLEGTGLIEVRTAVFHGIKKAELNNLERLCIAHWRMHIGNRLTNKTAGGDGGDTYEFKTPEELAEISAKLSASVKTARARRTPEESKEAGRKISAGKRNLPPEEVAKSHEKRLATIAAKSESEKAETKKRQSEAAKKREALMPSEKKISRGLNNGAAQKKAQAKKTKEERSAITKKGNDTRAKKSDAEKAVTASKKSLAMKLTLSLKTEEEKRKSEEKRKATLLAKSEDEKNLETANRRAAAQARALREAPGVKIARVNKAWETRRRKKAEALAQQEAK
jgi:hypothetical protein